jgi:hypothetical protein
VPLQQGELHFLDQIQIGQRETFVATTGRTTFMRRSFNQKQENPISSVAGHP